MKELEEQLVTPAEAAMLNAMRHVMRITVKRQVEQQIKDLINDNNYEFVSAAEEAVNDTLQDTDIRQLAVDAVASVANTHHFRVAIENAIVDLITLKMLDKRIWLPFRRVPWWRRTLRWVLNSRGPESPRDTGSPFA